MKRLPVCVTIVGCVTLLSCDNAVEPPTTGGIDLRVLTLVDSPTAAPAAGAAAVGQAAEASQALDSARIVVTGPTSKTVLTTPGQTVVIAELLAGSYTVVLEGWEGDVITFTGRITGVQVTVGDNVTAEVLYGPTALSFAALGDTNQLSVTSSTTVTWSSSDDGVVTVDASGLITAVSSGQAVITATAGTSSLEITVTVAQEVAAVTVTLEDPTPINPGATRLFLAAATDSNDNPVAGVDFLWASSNPNVLTVDQTGLATGIGVGNATISATARGFTGSAALTVTHPPPDPTTSTITAAPLSLPADGSSTALVTVQLKDATGANRTVGGDVVTLASTRGLLSTVTDLGNGTHSATLTSDEIGTANITGVLNGMPMTDRASVTLNATMGTVISNFDCALVNYIVGAGLLGEELADGQTDPAFFDFDRRTMGAAGLAGTLDCDGPPGGIFPPLDNTRLHANDLIAAIEGLGRPVIREGELATAMAYRGYTLLLMGEGMCSASLDGNPPRTPTVLWTMATSSFDGAAAIAAAAGTVPNILAMASVGVARATLNLGNFPSAARSASDVPPGFIINATYDGAAFRRFNHIFDRVNSTQDLTIEDDFRALGDARVPVVDALMTAADDTTALFTQSKYISVGSPITLASDVEARLIGAEASLNAGDFAGWLAALNALRATVALPPVVDPVTATARIDLHFSERARWLFLEGQHLGDQHRLVTQYGRDPAVLFTPASGAPFKNTGTNYGSVTCFPNPG